MALKTEREGGYGFEERRIIKNVAQTHTYHVGYWQWYGDDNRRYQVNTNRVTVTWSATQ